MGILDQSGTRKKHIMSTMAMRLDDVDASVVRKYVKFESKTIPDFIRDAVSEKIEDQEDLETFALCGSRRQWDALHP